MKYAPDDIKGPKGLQVARDALKRKVEPDTAMALAQQLFAAADDVKAQDGAFLIADELAKKGNAQGPCSCSATSILRSSPSAGPSKRTPIWPTTATRKPSQPEPPKPSSGWMR